MKTNKNVSKLFSGSYYKMLSNVLKILKPRGYTKSYLKDLSFDI